MAFAATNATNYPLAFSVGPLKTQLMNFSVASADTTGTITVDSMTSIVHVSVTGITQTAAPTFAGNVITLAFVDPAATRFGQIIVHGK